MSVPQIFDDSASDTLMKMLAGGTGEPLEICVSTKTWRRILQEASENHPTGAAPTGDTFMGVPVRLDDTQHLAITISWKGRDQLDMDR